MDEVTSLVKDSSKEAITFTLLRDGKEIKKEVSLGTVDLVSACLWDADRIRLSWEMGYEPKFFSTPYAKNIASLTKPQQDKYIKKQEDFLVAHNIKTRRQIEYEKIKDARCNACGTVFKVR